MNNQYYYESMMYQDMLKRETKLSINILTARIELLQMEYEIEVYRRKNGSDAGYEAAKKRFDVLYDALFLASSIDDEAYMSRLLAEDRQREIMLLNKKISSLEGQIEATERAWRGY